MTGQNQTGQNQTGQNQTGQNQTGQNQTALVTGSSGFIGRGLTRQLAQSGIVVTRLQRRPTMDPFAAECLLADGFDDAALRAALGRREFDMVFHLAGYGVSPRDRDPALMQAINVDAAAAIVRLSAAGTARVVIMAGSGSEYDLRGVTHPVAEDHPLQDTDLYGASKAAGGRAALATAAEARLPLVYARLFNVYGPGEAPHRLLPSLVESLTRAERVKLSAGTQLRDFLHIDDAAGALVALALAQRGAAAQRVVNVASGQPHSVRTFCETVADVMHKPQSLLGFGDLPMRPGETMFFSGDTSALQALTRWSPRYTFASGIEQAVQGLTRSARDTA